MPTATAKFPFEFKILEWANGFSRTMTGEDRGFWLTLDSAHAVQQIIFGGFDMAARETLAQSGRGWIFYDPFDAPEYAWLEWRNVPRAALERLLGKTLNEADFTHANKRIEHPISWRVMF